MSFRARADRRPTQVSHKVQLAQATTILLTRKLNGNLDEQIIADVCRVFKVTPREEAKLREELAR